MKEIEKVEDYDAKMEKYLKPLPDMKDINSFREVYEDLAGIVRRDGVLCASPENVVLCDIFNEPDDEISKGLKWNLLRHLRYDNFLKDFDCEINLTEKMLLEDMKFTALRKLVEYQENHTKKEVIKK